MVPITLEQPVLQAESSPEVVNLSDHLIVKALWFFFLFFMQPSNSSELMGEVIAALATLEQW